MIAFIYDLFFSPDRPFALFLNVSIASLCIISILLSVRVALIHLRREREAIGLVRALPQLTQASVRTAFLRSESILARRVEDMAAYSAAGHPIDAASLTGLNTVAFREMLEFPAALGRSMIVLGLFGTLWGLGVAVTGLADTLSTGGMSANALASAILETLGGMQTAFSTTLMGIVGSLLTGITVGFVRSRQTSTLADLERLMSTVLIPLYDTTEASLLQRAASALTAIQVQAAEDMKGIIASVGSEGEKLREQLEAEFSRIESAFEARAQHLIESTGRALAATLSILGEREEGEPTLAEYVRTVRASVEGLETAVKSAAGMIPSLEASLLQTIERHRIGLVDALTTHRNDLRPLMDRHSEAVEKLAATAERGAEHSATTEKILGQLVEVLNEVEGSWQEAGKAAEAMGRICHEAIRNGLAEVVANIRASQADSSEEREKLLRELASFEEVLEAHLTRMLNERGEVVRQMKELIGALQEATENSILKVGTNLEAKDSAAARELVKAVQDLAEELRVLARGRSLAALGGDGLSGPSGFAPLGTGRRVVPPPRSGDGESERSESEPR